ncbi:hypothetical protein K1719_015201 [Acacia pycnantha]|nr:hypothetical protein K1719_015201 [Acacia pycnantha]
MMIPSSSNPSSPSQPPSFQPQHRKADICQTCGDKGDLKRLINCAQCLVSAEHRYCIGKLPKDEDGTISWTCEECSLNDAKCRLTPLRSARISEATEAKYDRVKIERENHEEAYLGKSCKAESSDENQDLPIKKRRRLDSEDGNLIHEECEKYVDTKRVTTETIDEPYPESNNYGQAEPTSLPAWRGQLRINKAIQLGVGAYISTRACSKVHSTVSGLPAVVDVELLSRFDAWPPSFQRSPPTIDSIGVYIFPLSESDEKVFDELMSDLIERDLALRAIIEHNVELLIFSSRVFPTHDWRRSGKYYLWGVFRQKGTGDH